MEQNLHSVEEIMKLIDQLKREIALHSFIKGFLYGALGATIVILLFMLMR